MFVSLESNTSLFKAREDFDGPRRHRRQWLTGCGSTRSNSSESGGGGDGVKTPDLNTLRYDIQINLEIDNSRD
ncbi:hypothetical protein ElyMa_003842700 [Elysia marginata]|uniref:Uncharacterized protein n=1 Tax=Elysia marginata TaxID=1093978 RepID=A0AAV4FGN4_9GAST|nr:hypothetical protein ElyMa_003842700 [Elysia marginata]